MNRVYHYINGILNFPGSSENWNGRAVTLTHTRSNYRAEKIEYFCGPIDRAFGQKERARKLFQTVASYNGWQNVLVGHSNGCDVICDMLATNPGLSVDALHLVCGACDADFNKNGLNQALAGGQVGAVTVYCGGKDKALALAHSWAGKLFGYGTLGLHGPIGILGGIHSKVTTIVWPDYGHSDCWAESEFEKTMACFLA